MPKAKVILNLRTVAILLAIVSNVIFIAASPQEQQCIRMKPTVVIGPISQSGTAGQFLGYTITVTNNDSPGCLSSTFLIQSTFPESGFIHSPSFFRLTLNPGESRSRAVIIRSSPKSCVGPKTFRETAVNESAPSFSGFADAVLDIVPLVPDCGRAAPEVSIEPDFQETTGGMQLVYNVTIKNNDNPFCGGSSFTVTPTLPLGLTTHSPAEFHMFVPPGGSTSRPVIIQSDLLASGDLVFTETATHECASCLIGSAQATFRVNKFVFAQVYCCSSNGIRFRGGKVISATGCQRVGFGGASCSGTFVSCEASGQSLTLGSGDLQGCN